MTDDLPTFPYFADPVGTGAILRKQGVCPCCAMQRDFLYVGPIYCRAEVSEVCPWCIENGAAAAKWSASFNDLHKMPPGVPREIVEIILTRTPGYVTWQGNSWLFSETDALVFVGEVAGDKLLREGNADKIAACREALSHWNFPPDFDLAQVMPGGQPAIYLFQDRSSGAFRAYADMA